MITGIMAGKHLHVTNTGGSNYYNSSNQPMSGMMRYHSGGRVEVYDGNNWHQVSSFPTIDLDSTAQTAIDWVIKKQKEESELQSLLDKHPGLREAKEKFDILLALVREHNDRKD